MIKQYEQLLNEKGYIRELDSVSGTYTKKRDDECYVVMLSEAMIPNEVLMNYRNQIEQHYLLLGIKRVYQLCIVIQENAMFSQELIEQTTQLANLWLFAMDQGRMYQYEHQPLEFDGLSSAFEQFSQSGVKSARMNRTVSGSVPWVTIILVVMNVFLYFGPLVVGEYDHVIELGMNQFQYVVMKGQIYRLITSMFLHGSVSHLWNNMLVLCILGYYLEPALGKLKFSLIYFISGIGAGIFSLLVHMNGVGSIGASGAIFGLTGAILAMSIFYKGKIPGISTGRVICMCMASLYGGFAAVNVDNAAHIGGLIFGFLLVIITNNIRKKCT